MARRAISSEMYGKLVEAFFKYGQNWRACGAYAGVDARTAKIGWEKGWPAKGLPPIEDQIALKNVQARVARAEAAQKQAEEETARLKKAQDDAIKTETEEYEMTSQLRTWLANNAKHLVGPLNVVAIDNVQKMLSDHKAGKLTLTHTERMALVKATALINRYSAEAQRLALENERLRLGEPTAVLGLRMEAISAEEAREELVTIIQDFVDGKPLADEVTEAVKSGTAQDKLH